MPAVPAAAVPVMVDQPIIELVKESGLMVAVCVYNERKKLKGVLKVL